MTGLVYQVARSVCGNSYPERLHCWRQQLRDRAHIAPWYRRDALQRRWLP